MPTRRALMKAGTVGGAALLVPAAFVPRRPAHADVVPGGTLDPRNIRKYALPLFALPAMPGQHTGPIDRYEIAARQIVQRVLPPGLPPTKVFAFGQLDSPTTFHWPGYT